MGCAGRGQVRCEWGISPTQESLLTSIVFFGTMAGAYSWGVLGDARGRRVGFAATAAFTFAFGVLSAAAPNYLVRAAQRPALDGSADWEDEHIIWVIQLV